MGSKICMNEKCQATTSPEWKKGWDLKSGGFATLCSNCGSTYESSVFCETFHLEEDGWRKCKLCGKHIHCGCIASKYLHDYMDSGGVGCISCAKDVDNHSMRPVEIPSDDVLHGYGRLRVLANLQSCNVDATIDCNGFETGKLMQLSNAIEENQHSPFPQCQKGDTNISNGQVKPDDKTHPTGEGGIGFPSLIQQSVGQSRFSNLGSSGPTLGLEDMYESVAQPSLRFSLSTSLCSPNPILPFPGEVAEGKEQNKVPLLQQGQKTRHILPKPLKAGLNISSEAKKGKISQPLIARPPAEGRGRHQLLPRYWPRITDEELQQLSGDLNSTIVPLFEKVLSASDAGRIGRLVLPKACAEAYFPRISQSEGVPIRIQDIKRKEWTFQFRFWPNNNSRMYVLEGITPCIQSMQLRAGDTVTFSRIDPEGKLVMGCRKATIVGVQDAQTSSLPNGCHSGETSFFVVNESPPPEKHGGRINKDLLEQPMLTLEKKGTQNIGKSKRLHIHSEDALELQVTWLEAQDLFRSSPGAKPTIVMIENHDVEEYDEPPVFGKRTLFTAQASGEQEQWAQCDSCSKWRRLPMHVLLPPRWTCSDNIWDSNRCSCSAPDEIIPKEVRSLFRAGKDSKKQRTTENKVAQELGPSGLDALGTAAVLGDNAGDLGEHSVGATTKHPRHRPGCTCIVCIQPPSGKGKHSPMCVCNVCKTVKRRFKTLMLRKKKRQSELEAEVAQGKDLGMPKDGSEPDGTLGHTLPHMSHSENEKSQNGILLEVGETDKGQLDLNCHPNRVEEILTEPTGLGMLSLVHGASRPMEKYLKQNELGTFGPGLLSQAGGENEGRPPADRRLASVVGKLQDKGDEG
ncbi:unnamed protein product [Ilex paraguariensis]|uniref:B3 domain-containing transcription repressor VAL1 n=1 Tax=Ilex paraguariensis TaxID=185542 RepID=A0ABC8R572_9AQUA